MNLLCATELPGAEGLDISSHLRRLSFITEYIRKETARDLPRYRVNPRWIYKNENLQSENAFRIAHLATAMQGEFKMHYDARFLRDPNKNAKVNWRTAFADSRAILIHGLLGEKRAGIFTPISVVGVAIGRRLGYPVYLTGRPHYDFVRWDGEGEWFNAEILDGGCHIVRENDGYHKWPQAMRPEEVQSGCFLKNFSPADELALCLFCRAWVLESNFRFEDSLPVWAKCCFLAPKNPEYARRARNAVGEALFMRKKGRPMEWAGKRFLKPVEVVEEDPRNLLSPKLAALAFAIAGHAEETEGNSASALWRYRVALDTDPDNPDHTANFERFRDQFHEQLVEGHIKTHEAIRRNAPHVKLPPLEESIRQFRESLRAERPVDQPPPDKHHMQQLLRSARSAQAWRHQARGKQAMEAGRWIEAQTAFAQAFFGGDEKEREIFRADLRTAITKDVEQITPPNATWEEDEGADPRNNPLFKMPDDLVAFIWHNRGRVLERLGRYAEAFHAFRQAEMLMPGHAEYAADKARVAALQANPETTPKPAPPSESYLPKDDSPAKPLAMPPGVYPVGLVVLPSFHYHETALAAPGASFAGEE
jgi:tetratricopeptide (TPR) repeat protein